MALKIENICIARGGNLILSDLSFDLSAGQGRILTGHNGVGKTSLLRVIAGLGDASSGVIRTTEKSIFLGHRNGLKPALTVFDNLQIWSDVFQMHSKNIYTALEVLNIGALAHMPVRNLSEGQQRRVALSRLFLSDHRIWLLDEPTVGLDVASVDLFEEALKAHFSSGGMAIIATHIKLDVPADNLELSAFKPSTTSEAWL